MKSLEPMFAQVAIKEKFQTIIDHICNGGSLLNLCALWQVRYSDVMRQIRLDKDLFDKYSKALEDRTEWARERILQEQQALALFNIKDAYNADGTIKQIKDMPESVTAAIKELDKDGAVKFLDKNKSLDQYHKQMGLFVDRREVSGTINWEHILIEAEKLNNKE